MVQKQKRDRHACCSHKDLALFPPLVPHYVIEYQPMSHQIKMTISSHDDICFPRYMEQI
jgi:hypothetical protein